MAESNNDRTAALKGEKIQASAGLLTAYVGPNAAHRELRTALANAKAIAYILIDGDAKVLKAFLEQAEEIKRQAKGADYAFGVGGRATATTLQMSVHLTGGEIDLIAGARGGFISLTLGLVYREVYRAFETYLVALFQEIGLRDKRILFSNRNLSHEEALRPASQDELHRLIIEKRKIELTRGGLKGFEEFFEGLGLPIVPMIEPPSLAQQESVLARLRAASAIRNVIEHNNGIVDAEFLKAVPGQSYKLGDRVVINTPELGDAISAVEWAADELNRRAMAKFFATPA
jgi:hypothetical protein